LLLVRHQRPDERPFLDPVLLELINYQCRAIRRWRQQHGSWPASTAQDVTDLSIYDAVLGEDVGDVYCTEVEIDGETIGYDSATQKWTPRK
jgi:hypothetical protein